MDNQFTYPLTDLEMLTYVFQNEYALYILLAALVFGFVLSFIVGANDSANSWATAFGAGTVSIPCAFMLGSIFEVLGSVFLSGEVVKGIAGNSSVINLEMYRSNETIMIQQFMNNNDTLEKEKEFMLGLVTSMISSQVWQMIATYFSWPVSGTHAIISALLGFTLVESGYKGVHLGEPFFAFTTSPNSQSIISKKPDGIFKVLYGLILSPLISLLLGFILSYLLYKFVVSSKPASSWAARTAYSGCLLLILMSMTFFFITSQSSPPAGWHKEFFGALVGLAVGLVGALFFMFLFIPILIKMNGKLKLSFGCLLKRIPFCHDWLKKLKQAKKDNIIEEQVDFVFVKEQDFVDESDEVKRIFCPLEVIVACYKSLNHGANDVANCIGPLVTVWLVYQTPIGYKSDVKMYGILLWGGLGIALGLVFYGQNMIETVGTKISRLTPSLGFTVDLTSSMVVMFCSILGIPTSTTHCQVMGMVGAGVAKGWVDSNSFKQGLKTVDFTVMRNIVASWIITIPFSLLLSMIVYSFARVVILGPF